MMKDFTNLYPEHVDKYKIQYPIDDGLLLVMPELHNSTKF